MNNLPIIRINFQELTESSFKNGLFKNFSIIKKFIEILANYSN